MKGGLLEYEIVSKIIIREDKVFFVGAYNDIRPLVFTDREEPVLSHIFRTEGLRALLAEILRDIHRGRIHLRADSRITRAIRKCLHAITLEGFLALEEDTAVELLSAAVERTLSDPAYDPRAHLGATQT